LLSGLKTNRAYWLEILLAAGLSVPDDFDNANFEALQSKIASFLAKGDLCAYECPYVKPRPRAKEVVYEDYVEKPVPLAPESAPAPPPPAEKSKPPLPKPAKSLSEARARLEAARTAVVAAKEAGKPLPPSAFSLEDKKAVVVNGLEEKITVRVIETKYAGDNGTIGRPTGAGHSYSFSAPLSMVEHGDTDVEALLNAFGTRYNPDSEYTILLMDLNKMEEVGDVQPVIPTYENIYELIEESPQLTRVDLDIVKATLNDDFAPKYKEFGDAVEKLKIKSDDDEGLTNLAEDMGFSEDESEMLKKRHAIAGDISTWQEFTGNGMTQDTNVKKTVAYGTVEVFTFDKRPMRLGELQNKKAILRMSA